MGKERKRKSGYYYFLTCSERGRTKVGAVSGGGSKHFFLSPF